MRKNHYTLVAREAIKSFLKTVPAGTRIGVGVSGGADSTALLLGLSTLYKGSRASLIHVVTVDHQLQESTASASRNVAQFAENLGFTAHIVPVVVEDSSQGAEAAARVARYDAFNNIITENNLGVFLLGHTKSDQAEQVFLGLLRGSGTRSLSGMPSTSGVYRRPFLNTLSRKDTQKVCEENNVDYWCDPHNDLTIYQRVSIRQLIQDTERKTGQDIVTPLVRSALISSEDAEALDFYTVKAYQEVEENNWEISFLNSVPVAIRKRVFKTKLTELGVTTDTITSLLLNRVNELIEEWHGQGGVSFSKGVTVLRMEGKIIFTEK